jgi:hypothetical protein
MEKVTIILSATGEKHNNSLKLLNPKEGISNFVGSNACSLAHCSEFVPLQYLVTVDERPRHSSSG